MNKSKNGDLTSGPILKNLAELALPIMISSMLGTAYNITDMAWIGLLGAKAVAGVGVGGMYVWLSQGIAALPRMGGQVNVAQSCGRKNYEQARSYAFYPSSAGLLSSDRRRNLLCCQILYPDHLRIDPFSLFESDPDRSFHSSG